MTLMTQARDYQTRDYTRLITLLVSQLHSRQQVPITGTRYHYSPDESDTSRPTVAVHSNLSVLPVTEKGTDIVHFSHSSSSRTNPKNYRCTGHHCGYHLRLVSLN